MEKYKEIVYISYRWLKYVLAGRSIIYHLNCAQYGTEVQK